MADDPYASLGTVVDQPAPAASSAPAADAYASLGDQQPAQTPDQIGSVTNPDGSERKFKLNPDGKTITWLPDKPSTALSVLDGIADTGTFGFGDELIGARDAAKALLTGGDPVAAYDAGRDRIRGDMAAEENTHPYARMAGQLLGGLAIPVGGAEDAAFQAGRTALRAGATQAEARAIAARAATRFVAGTGAIAGGAYGFGSADGDAGERLLGAGVGAAEGGVGGAALGLAGEAIAPRIAANAAAARAAPAAALTDGQRVAQAADRQGIDVLPADVGGPTTKRLTAAGAQLPGSAAPIINRAQSAIDQSQAVRDRVAQTVGQVLNPEAAGQNASAGARSFIARTSARGNALYRQAENAADGVTVDPVNAKDVLQQNIDELGETPGGSAGLAHLQGLQDALSQGQFTVRGIRNMRTQLRDNFTEAGLRGSDIERRANQVVDAANDDVNNALTAAGRPDAAQAYRVADRYWRNRLSTIDDTLAPIVGKDGDASGEQVVQRLQASMKGNNARFVSFVNALPPEEQSNVRASLISQLGRAKDGAQNDTGSKFSLETFLSNWNSIGETAKSRLFGPEQRAAMNDLATVASGARATNAYANRSNTGGVVGGFLTGATGLGGLPTLATSLIAQYGAGRLLSSPQLVRWLARAPRTSLSQPAYLDRLTRIARAQPAIANDVLSLRDRLLSATANGGAKLAAQEPDNESSRVDR